MITIIVPEWLVWTAIGMFVVQTVMNAGLAYLTRKNGAASRELTKKLTELALRR